MAALTGFFDKTPKQIPRSRKSANGDARHPHDGPPHWANGLDEPGYLDAVASEADDDARREAWHLNGHSADSIPDDSGGDGVDDEPGASTPCPVKALGHLAGVFHFLDVRGQKRELSARQLGARYDLLALFGGSDTWLREAYPKRVAVKSTDKEGKESTAFRVVDFQVGAAAAALQRACFFAGLWGDHIMVRRPGIWRDPEGTPVVHCGDAVLLGDQWHQPGERTGDQIWAAAAPTARPTAACGADVGQELSAGLTGLWNWREVGSPIAALGLIANAYYGSATEWRPAGFVTGSTGAGKSALLRVMRGAIPLHHYDNDTSKAGIEQSVHARAMAIIIDEAADRANRDSARALVDLVLSAAGDEGTKGSRGTVDGKGRRIEVAGLILMFSINPPELEPQHLGRFTLIDLARPLDGADHRDAHRALARYARAHGPSLWGRALAGWDRYNRALAAFRAGLGNAGCSPREMDQAGALLAGWWVLVRDGVPDARGVAEGIAALDPDRTSGYIRRSEDVDADDRPQRMLQHLLSSMVALHRSTDREPVGKLLEIAWGDGDPLRNDGDARELLTHYGIRVIRRGEEIDKSGRPVPRMASGNGLWFSNTSPELRRIFAGTPFEGERWRYELLRLETARRSGGAVRIGTVSTRATWLSRSEIDPEKPP